MFTVYRASRAVLLNLGMIVMLGKMLKKDPEILRNWGEIYLSSLCHLLGVMSPSIIIHLRITSPILTDLTSGKLTHDNQHCLIFHSWELHRSLDGFMADFPACYLSLLVGCLWSRWSPSPKKALNLGTVVMLQKRPK